MVTIKPFKALRYNDSLRDNIKYLVSPPYDLYESGDETDKKLKSIKENFSYIKKPHGTEDEKYINAKKKLDELIKKKVLITEDSESMYVYKQKAFGREFLGFIAALKLEDYKNGNVMRHEMTNKNPSDDRRKLLEVLKVNTGVIYTLFDDKENIIQGILKSIIDINTPLFEFIDDKSVEHHLFKVSGKTCDMLKEFMREKKLYIADGHHRYGAALDYAKKYDPTLKKEKPENYILAYMVPDASALILPYNRIIHSLDQRSYVNFLATASKNFEILEKTKNEIITPEKPHRIIVYYNKKVYELYPKKIPETSVGKLDVSILQKDLLELLGYDDKKLKACEGIIYPHADTTLETIRELVDTHPNAIGFSLYPTSVKELERVAEDCSKNERIIMPPKSTFFYPKPRSGLVSYKF